MNKLITATLAAGTAAAGLLIAGTGNAAGTATAQPNTHIIKGEIVEAPASTEYDWPSGYVSLDQDYALSGQRIGSDVTTCHAATPTATSPTAASASCYAAIALKAGLVTVAFTETTSSATIHGTVLGGAGRYHHATGTITIVETNNDTGPSTAEWTLTLHE